MEQKEFAEIKKIEKKFYKNIWMISTIVLAVALIVLIIYVSSDGSSINSNVVGQKVVDFAQSQGANATLISVGEENDLFKVTLSIDGQEFPVYVTKDGQNLVPSLIPLTAAVTADNSQPTQQDVPKTNKPVANAFIFSYCPYGLQFEKALLPVYDLMKNVADINIVAIGAMHGDFEKIESLRQIAIEQIYGKDKLFAYLKEFDTNSNIGSCQGDATCLDKYLPAVYTKLGVDKTKVESYMAKSSEAIYNQQMQQASSLGISGSPTFVVNGVTVQAGRNAEAIKEAICSAFTTAPSECLETLSSTLASPGFGDSTGASTGAQC